MRLAREHEVLVTIEEGAIGGFGSYVLGALAEHGALDRGLKVHHGAAGRLHRPGTRLRRCMRAGLDAKGIVAKVFEALGKDIAAETVKLA